MSRTFRLHTSQLNSEGCPVDPRAPVPPPWDSDAGGSLLKGGAPSQVGPQRTAEIGQLLAKYARSPECRAYEELFRSEPNESWYDPARDPEHPTQFELGTIRPGTGTTIIIMDYSVQPYGFSGTTALDFAALEDDEISSSFGYSLEINGQNPGRLRYRLDPVRSTLRQQAVRFNQKLLDFDNVTEDDYVRSQAAEYASAAGYGTGLHPQNAQRYLGRIIPFGEFLHDDQVMTSTGVVFRPIEVPLAFVQIRFSGFEMSSDLGHSVEHALRVAMR